MSDIALQLYNELLPVSGLTTVQQETFKVACQRVVNDHATESFNTKKVAAKTYLKLIQEFPDLSL